MDPGDEFKVDLVLDEASADNFDVLVLPGGAVSPDLLRTFPVAVALIQRFMEKDKIVAAICHGSVPLVEANVLKGRTLTSVRNIRTDLVNAGGNWIDEELVVDHSGRGILITSRGPHDLEVFCQGIINALVKE
jgi:protease I